METGHGAGPRHGGYLRGRQHPYDTLYTDTLYTHTLYTDTLYKQGMVVGPGTEAIAGEGSILTAGGLDTHIHFICPQVL